MIRKIKIELSVSSITNAASDLERIANSLTKRWVLDEITRRVSQAAAEEARTHFSGDVTVEAHDNGVIAAGRSVVFEEFGAGARISDPYPGGADVSFEIRRGAYSDLHGGEYARTGYDHWTYNGERYEYVTPTNGLFYGSEKAIDEAPRIIEEVLNEEW